GESAARRLRSHSLSKRGDLFRSPHAGASVPAVRGRAAARRLSGAGQGRDPVRRRTRPAGAGGPARARLPAAGVSNEILVRVADLPVGSNDDVLVTIGLGSCVAVVLHDPVARVGGLAHVLLPSQALSRKDDSPAKFPQTAVPKLLELMSQLGANTRRTTARLAGGASMFAGLAAPGTVQMGERNTVACRQGLMQLGVPIAAQATGGDHRRTLKLWVTDGRVEVSSVSHGIQSL